MYPQIGWGGCLPQGVEVNRCLTRLVNNPLEGLGCVGVLLC